MINTGPISPFLARIARIQPHVWGNRVSHILQSPSREEIIYHLREAINICYSSDGRHLPKILHTWEQSKIMIDFLTLPEDIQEGIRGIIMQSSFGKSFLPRIIYNIPHKNLG